MKIKEFREKNGEELKKIMAEKKARVLTLRFDISAKQVKNNQEYRTVKKDIAKILTVLKEKEAIK